VIDGLTDFSNIGQVQHSELRSLLVAPTHAVMARQS